MNTCEPHEVSLCNIRVIPNCLLLFLSGLRREEKLIITILTLPVLCFSEIKTLMKPSEAPQRSVKIKNYFFLSGIGALRVKIS